MKRPTIHPTLRLLLLSATVLACLAEASWFKDRDNTMIPAKDKVGRSLVSVSAKGKKSIGVEVYCPAYKNKSVILTTAHGVFDTPEEALKEGRKTLRRPSKNFNFAINMPWSKKVYSKASTDAQFHSPRKDSKKAWSDPSTDYAFVVLDKKLNKKNKGVKILGATPDELSKASKEKKLEVYLYRAKTRYQTKTDGTPDFNFKTYGSRTSKETYAKPLRVKKPCRVVSLGNFSTTDCPIEIGVSGSPMVSKVKNQTYISGIINSGTDDQFFKKFNTEKSYGGSNFRNSSDFCGDYEKLCGTTCIDINAVLHPEKASKTNAATDVEN